MSQHIDVIRPNWQLGTETVVARVVCDGDHVRVEDIVGDWKEIVLRPLTDPVTHDLVAAEKEPARFFELLPQALHGSYLYASEPHGEGSCGFVEHDENAPRAPVRPIGSR